MSSQRGSSAVTERSEDGAKGDAGTWLWGAVTRVKASVPKLRLGSVGAGDGTQVGGAGRSVLEAGWGHLHAPRRPLGDKGGRGPWFPVILTLK